MKYNRYRRSIQIVSNHESVEIQLYRRNEQGETVTCKCIHAERLSPHTLAKLDIILRYADCQCQSVFRTLLITNAFFCDGVRL